MISIGFEVEGWLRRLQDVLTQIRNAIDERSQALRDLSRTLDNILRGIEDRLSVDGLHNLIQQMEKMQDDLWKMESFLSPEMLNDLRLRLKRSQDELSQAAERIAGVHQGIRALREALRQQVEEQNALQELMDEMKRGEDMVTVLIRSLSHFQESLPTPDADTTVRVLADLLQGGLRLAALIFDPRQLQEMSAGPQGRPVLLDLLRKRWGDWLRELARYIWEVSQRVEPIAALEGGTQTEAFRAALEDFQNACRRVAGPGSLGLPPFLKPAPPFSPTPEPQTPEGGSP
jgi:methyl-accepting chemotaxis protein